MIRTGLCRLKKHDKIANVQLQFPHPKDYRLDAPIAGVNRLWLAFWKVFSAMNQGRKANRGYTDIIIIHGIHYPRFSVEKCYILS